MSLPLEITALTLILAGAVTIERPRGSLPFALSPPLVTAGLAVLALSTAISGGWAGTGLAGAAAVLTAADWAKSRGRHGGHR